MGDTIPSSPPRDLSSSVSVLPTLAPSVTLDSESTWSTWRSTSDTLSNTVRMSRRSIAKLVMKIVTTLLPMMPLLLTMPLLKRRGMKKRKVTTPDVSSPPRRSAVSSPMLLTVIPVSMPVKRLNPWRIIITSMPLPSSIVRVSRRPPMTMVTNRLPYTLDPSVLPTERRSRLEYSVTRTVCSLIPIRTLRTTSPTRMEMP
mmetsp:Transcript_24822/g.37956  ORF Transcript_24822/g.37956 Transcript_24822/m.37956 type:complete len:200 (-) Transcript_24822:65-664(-)